MSKLLTALAATATLMLHGCSLLPENGIGDGITRSLDDLPLIYRPSIQQGNVVTQDLVNSLQPGMTKRQVRHVLGTPMLVDLFHQDRWDFVYTLGKGSNPDEIKKVALFFENDSLTRIEGDLRPQPEAEREAPKRDVVVSVPDWDGNDRTLVGRLLKGVGLGD